MISSISQSTLGSRCAALFERLVPDSGQADTVEGETLRAVCRIWYQYFNDGDYFWKGYGTETAGPSHAYLVQGCPIAKHLRLILDRAAHRVEDEYEAVINQAVEFVVSYVEGREKCGDSTPNTIDSRKFRSLYHDDLDPYGEGDD